MDSWAGFRLKRAGGPDGAGTPGEMVVQDGFGPVSKDRDTDFTETFEGYVLMTIPLIVLILTIIPIWKTRLSLNAITDWDRLGRVLRAEQDDPDDEFAYQDVYEIAAQATGAAGPSVGNTRTKDGKESSGGGATYALSNRWASLFEKKVYAPLEHDMEEDPVNITDEITGRVYEAPNAPTGWRCWPLVIIKMGFACGSAAACGFCAALANSQTSFPLPTIVGCAVSGGALVLAAFISFRWHFLTYRPSPLLQSYALVQVLAIAVRVRTAWLAHRVDPEDDHFAFALVLSIALGSACLYGICEGIARISRRKARACGIAPDETASLLSVATSQFCQPIFTYAYKQHRRRLDLDEHVLPPLQWDLRSTQVASAWELAWDAECEKAKALGVKPNFWSFFNRHHYPELIFPGLLGGASYLVSYIAPVILDHFTGYLNNVGQGIEVRVSLGWEYAVGLSISILVQSMMLQTGSYYLLPGLAKMRGGLMAAVYKKSFRLAPEEFGRRSVGDLSNHVSVDAEKFFDEWPYQLPLLVAFVPQLALGSFILYRSVKWAFAPGLGWMLFLVLGIGPFVGKSMGAAFGQTLAALDAKNTVITETFSEIKFVKLNAWEPPLFKKIMECRQEELSGIYKIGVVYAQVGGVTGLGRGMSPVVVLGSFVAMYGDLDSGTVAAATTALGLIQAAIDQMPMLLQWVVGAIAAGKRIAAYLTEAEEITPAASEDLIGKFGYEMQQVTSVPKLPCIENATFSWFKDPDPTQFKLRNIDLQVQRGELLGILGMTASGKSSLIAAMLGQMNVLQGKLTPPSWPIAYCPQKPFIVAASLEDNITWGLSHNAAMLQKTLVACCLEADLSTIPGGLKAELGDKGANLSGGQRARIALARACYAAMSGVTELVILDDPLSAVDADTDRRLFDRVVGPEGILARCGCTRILVTHAAHHFHELDRSYILDKGAVVCYGPHAKLLDFEQYRSLVAEHMNKEKNDEQQTEQPAPRPSVQETAEEGALTEAEKMIQGRVSLKTYTYFMKAGGIGWILISMACMVLNQGGQQGARYFLSHVTDYVSKQKADPNVKLPVSMGVAIAIFSAVSALGVAFGPCAWYFMQAKFCVRAVKQIFEKVMPVVLRATPEFFNTTPGGRIITRLSSDMRQIDTQFALSFGNVLTIVASALVTLIASGIGTNGLFFAVFPVALPIYGLFLVYGQASSRAVRRLDAGRTRAPLYGLCTETFAGVNSIIPWGAQDRYIAEFNKRIDRNQRAKWLENICNCYFAFRVSVIGALLVFAGAAFCLALKKSISPGFAGLAIGGIFQVAQILATLAQLINFVETAAVHVERVVEWFDLEPEAPESTLEDEKLPEGWPEYGNVEFVDYSTRYRENLPDVLKKVNIKIKGGKRVAIVGRSGSGKSTLTLALFRLLEPTGGTIFIDGADTSTLGLHRLRSSIGIIPQEPALFGGNIRTNLAPLSNHDDEELWAALEAVHLKDYVSKLEEKLDTPVQIGGKNFSTGQLQQLALARALLKNVKVLVLDEATASLDFVTDKLIQQTIRRSFVGCTVITIAHRIRTIMDSDLVVSMQKGTVAECDSPANLLRNPDGIFYNLALESGEIDASGEIPYAVDSDDDSDSDFSSSSSSSSDFDSRISGIGTIDGGIGGGLASPPISSPVNRGGGDGDSPANPRLPPIDTAQLRASLINTAEMTYRNYGLSLSPLENGSKDRLI